MSLISMRCAFCETLLTDVCPTGNHVECSSCGAHLFLKGMPTEGTEPESVCFVPKKLVDHPDLKMVFKSIYKILDNHTSSEEVISLINDLVKDNKDCATSTSYVNDYEKIKGKLASICDEDENLILFKSSAYFGFNKIKTGMFITDKRVGFIDKKQQIHQIELKEIDSFAIDFGSTIKNTYWYPNGENKIFLSTISIMEYGMGFLIAYMLLRISELTGPEHRVELRLYLINE